MKTQGAWRLSTMMALAYSVQGSFWPLLAVHLGDLGIDARSRGWIFGTMAIGSLAVPLGAGQLVDRLMPTQRFLSLAYGLGAAILGLLASGLITRSGPMFLMFLVYWLILSPCYGLCNSLAMRHLDDPPRQFGGVRLWGTVGWMAAGWLVSLVMAWGGTARAGGGAHEAFLVAAVLAGFMSLYCTTLPDTPPLAAGEKLRGGFRVAIDLVRQRQVSVLLVASFGVYLTMPLVYQVMPAYLESRGLPRAWTSMTMTIGQWPEVFTLAILPWLIRRLGYRRTISLGIAAWFIRFLSLSFDPPLWLAAVGAVLHGVGVGCFTVGGQVFLDSKAPSHHRASVQALFLVMTSGLGALLGSLLSGELGTPGPGLAAPAFLVPCVINGALLTYFMTGFRSHVTTMDRAGAANADLPPRPHNVRGTVACAGNLMTESADG